jgi:hypothetical protein
MSCSSLGSRSPAGKLPTGMTNSAAARLHSISSCHSSREVAAPPRCRVWSAASANNVCAISWATEKRTRSRGLVGLNSIFTAVPLGTVRASATSLLASTGIFSRSAIARGLKGGPDHPASRARRTSSRALVSIRAIGSELPANLRTDLFVHRMFFCDTGVPRDNRLKIISNVVGAVSRELGIAVNPGGPQ